MSRVDRNINIFFGVTIGLLLIAMLVIWLTAPADPVIAHLKQSEWRCAQGHEERHMKAHYMGKSVVWWPVTEDVCDAYVRQKH